MALKQRTDELINRFYAIPNVKRVYYEPPDNVRMEYPCVRINRKSMNQRYANNKVYMFTPAYDIYYITKESDDPMTEKFMREFEMIRHNRTYHKDNLRYEVYTLYFK